ncbi:hypothetical protein ANCCAN_07904 [Ancylostoma caninum]|uniref:Uncharacterized protein n=1 Tax=Ancylostoma caninum TaxID=29170 RepID=A0A368GR16_ANCCA|nr:hypothetical protein ANCCAN_07904 [Ancylostoma caninum]
MNRSHPDALHMLSAGVTVDLMKDKDEVRIYYPKNFSRLLFISHQLIFILCPLTAAQNFCADPCGSVCILAYWLLVRVMADGELDDDTIRGIKNVTKTMKLLWHDAAIKLFTLKLHGIDGSRHPGGHGEYRHPTPMDLSRLPTEMNLGFFFAQFRVIQALNHISLRRNISVICPHTRMANSSSGRFSSSPTVE